ncbi:MAG TPA: DUF4276 family protein [Chthonomonadaceae bacterium]|nr:DUF4276 family protein [Chthonomonadaceae bacterium]
MRRVSIASIVEGDGEVEAVPVLLRRLVQEIDPTLYVLHFPEPIRISRAKIVKEGELERYLTLAAGKISPKGAILILLDADENCPATLAPQLLQRALAARSDLPISVVLAKQEYEAWFLAAAESLRNQQGLSTTLEPPPDPEGIRGAKEWLRKHMEGSRTYRETVDQKALTYLFDLQTARQAPSFDKMYREIQRLLDELDRP